MKALTFTSLAMALILASPGAPKDIIDISAGNSLVAPAPHSDRAQLKRGDSRGDVPILQKALNDHGEHLTVDGIFGRQTEKAVKDFQAQNGLESTGEVDSGTWIALAAKPAPASNPAREFEIAKQAAEEANAQAAEVAKSFASLNSELEKAHAQLASKTNGSGDLQTSNSAPQPAETFGTNEQPPALYVDTPDTPALATAEIRVGDVLMATGNFAAALERYQDGLAIADRLAKSDPENTDWQRNLSIAYNRIGEALAAGGNLTEALRTFQDSLAICERLAKADSSKTERQRDLAISQGAIAAVLARQGDAPRALDLLQQGRVIIARLVEQSPDNAQLVMDLAVFDAYIATLEQASLPGAQRGSESCLTQPKPSLGTGTQGLQASAPEALMDQKAAAEGRTSANAEIPPSAASTFDQTETTPEQRPVSETDRETNAKAELQPSHGAKRSAGAFGSREHAPGTHEPGDDSTLVSAVSSPAPSQNLTIPDLPAVPIRDPQEPHAARQPPKVVATNTPDLSAPSKASDPPAEAAGPELQEPQAADQPAEAVAVNTPDLSAPSKAPDPPAEAAGPELQEPQAADQPAEAVAVNTPEQHLNASPPNYSALPPVTTAPPSVDVTALPSDAENVPKPVRKPVVQHPAGKPVFQKPTRAPPSVDVTALRSDAENVLKPVRKPVVQHPAGKPVFQKPTRAPPSVDVTALPSDAENVPKPVRKPFVQHPAGKPVIQKPVAKPDQNSVWKPVKRADVYSKPAGRPRANAQILGSKRAGQKIDRSLTADLLAGGL